MHDSVQPLSASSWRAYDNQLCNPVIETPEGRGGPRGPVYAVSNSAAHLYCFTDNTGTAPEVNVTVQNQFGDGNYTVGRATRLCLPSWKFDPNQDPSNPLAAGSTSPSSWSDPANLNFESLPVLPLTSVEREQLHEPPALRTATRRIRDVQHLRRVGGRVVRTGDQASRECGRYSRGRSFDDQRRRRRWRSSGVLRGLRLEISSRHGGQPILGVGLVGDSEPGPCPHSLWRPALPCIIQDRRPAYADPRGVQRRSLASHRPGARGRAPRPLVPAPANEDDDAVRPSRPRVSAQRQLVPDARRGHAGRCGNRRGRRQGGVRPDNFGSARRERPGPQPASRSERSHHSQRLNVCRETLPRRMRYPGVISWCQPGISLANAPLQV